MRAAWSAQSPAEPFAKKHENKQHQDQDNK
jgi:hypothetical protein